MGTLTIRQNNASGTVLYTEGRSSTPSMSPTPSGSVLTGATFNCKDKVPNQNIVVGGKTFNCKDKMMPYSIYAIYKKALVLGSQYSPQLSEISGVRGWVNNKAFYRRGGIIDSNMTFHSEYVYSHNYECVGTMCQLNSKVACQVGGREGQYDSTVYKTAALLDASTYTKTIGNLTYGHVRGCCFGFSNHLFVCTGWTTGRITSGSNAVEWIDANGTVTTLTTSFPRPSGDSYTTDGIGFNAGSYALYGAHTGWSGDYGGAVNTMYYWTSSGTYGNATALNSGDDSYPVYGFNGTYSFVLRFTEPGAGYQTSMIVDRYNTSLTKTIATFSVPSTYFSNFDGDAFSEGFYAIGCSGSDEAIWDRIISNDLTVTTPGIITTWHSTHSNRSHFLGKINNDMLLYHEHFSDWAADLYVYPINYA